MKGYRERNDTHNQHGTAGPTRPDEYQPLPVPGARLIAWRLAMHRTKRQKTNTQKAPGDMESTVTPSRKSDRQGEYQHIDHTSNQRSSIEDDETSGAT